MADQDTSAGGNGADDNGQPQVSILAQYVKDLSVENPSAPQVYSWQVQPGLDVQFNLNVEGAGEGTHEVTLKFDISRQSSSMSASLNCRKTSAAASGPMMISKTASFC